MKKKMFLDALTELTSKEKSVLKNELKTATKYIDDNENILAYCTMAKLTSHPTLFIMTENRFLHFFQEKFLKTGTDTYQFDNVDSPFVIKRDNSVDLTFQYNGQTKRFTFSNSEKNQRNMDIISEKIKAEVKGYNEGVGEDINSTKQKISVLFEDGHKELGLSLPWVDMIQLSNDKIYFVEGKNATEYFTFHRFDRAENMHKSTIRSLGYSMLGNTFFGQTGAIGMAAGSMKGQDLSTAILFLTNEQTGAKQAAVIQCDSKTYAKLSKFSTTPEDTNELEETTPAYDKYAEIERIHSLKEKGILSDEEFETEKAKLLK